MGLPNIVCERAYQDSDQVDPPIKVADAVPMLVAYMNARKYVSWFKDTQSAQTIAAPPQMSSESAQQLIHMRGEHRDDDEGASV